MMGSEPSTGMGSSRGFPGGTGSGRMQTNSWTMAAGRPQAPHFDTSTGRLHADVATMLALVDLHVDERNGLSAGRHESLSRAGVFVDGRLHPALRARLDAVARPSARLEVEVGTPSSTRLHQGWVHRVSALVVDHGDEVADLLEIEAAFLPATIAYLTHLQPRPRLDGRGGQVDGGALDALRSGSRRSDAAADLAAAAATWPAVAACLRTGSWRSCGVDVAHHHSGSTSTQQVVWLDTPAGALRLEDDAAGPVLAGTTTGSIWQELVQALRADPVLAREQILPSDG